MSKKTNFSIRVAPIFQLNKLGEDLMRFRERWITSILQSKRAWTFIGAALLTTLGRFFDIPEDILQGIGATWLSWLVGDSIRPSETIFGSRRFWLTIVTSAAGFLANYTGFELTPDQINTIAMAVGAWILGDSWRATCVKS